MRMDRDLHKNEVMSLPDSAFQLLTMLTRL